MDQILNVIQWSGAENIFSIGSFGIRYYSLCWLLAFGVAYALMLQVFKKEGKTQEDLDKLTIYIFLGTLIGARLGHCLFYEFDYYKDHLLEMFLPMRNGPNGWEFTGFAGLASHGGAIGILIALYLYAKNTKTNFMWIADRLLLVVPVSAAFIRIGNFMNSEIIGKPASEDLPWAVVFKNAGLRPEELNLIPRHPAQIYEAIGYIILFFILWTSYKKNHKPKPGLLFGIGLIGLFTIRFILEFFKENQEAFENEMFINMGQLLSIPFIILGIYFVTRKQAKA